LNPQDPLAQLHALREPGTIGWWPLAPGWWVLLAIAVLLLATLAFYCYRRYRANAYRRQACLQLRALYGDWRSNDDNTRYLGAVNALLKSVALRAFPRRDVASRNGTQWVAFLNQTHSTSTGAALFDEDFATAAYRPEHSSMDCEKIYLSASKWIKQHRAAP
jgi:hypothetical protein